VISHFIECKLTNSDLYMYYCICHKRKEYVPFTWRKCCSILQLKLRFSLKKMWSRFSKNDLFRFLLGFLQKKEHFIEYLVQVLWFERNRCQNAWSFSKSQKVANEKDHFWRIFRSWSNCVWFLTLLNANSPTPIYTCITVFVTKERNTCHSLEGSVIQYCN
jgi:hypothetical protein